MRNVIIVTTLLAILYSVIWNDLGMVHAVDPWFAGAVTTIVAIIVAVLTVLFRMRPDAWMWAGGLMDVGLVLGSEKFGPAPFATGVAIAFGLMMAGVACAITKRDE